MKYLRQSTAGLGMLMLLSACQSPKENSQGENFLSQVDKVQSSIQNDSALLGFFENPMKPLAPAFTSLPQGSTRPRGWLAEMMRSDLDKGVVGALDDLYPGIRKDDLFNKARRGGLADVPEMGDLMLTGEAWEQSIMWWNAETIGNWWDGFIRHAYLTNNAQAIKQAQSIVANLINSQGPDGYIGIYKPNLRYQHEGSNGELWAQTTAFRTLLGYYELTQEQHVLEAVEKAMALTMEKYGPNGNDPFDLNNEFGGVTHGLMLTDVCETLFRITGKQVYQDYAVYLYKAFSTYNLNRAFNDLRYPYLTDKDSLFTGHGVHVYEHFRTLVNAYYNTGYPELKVAYANALNKLDKAILPSGAGHGNEFLAGIEADPSYTSTEYCTMLELRNSLSSIFQKTGDIRFADHAEKLSYNGMMGFRNPEGTAITYGKSDNCYIMDSQHHGASETHKDVRYKYSPTHSDPAVCCVPNYSRNFPYFLDQMWLQASDGLVAAMYAPSELHTTINGVDINIEQITNYPFSDKVQLNIEVSQPIAFKLYFRKPEWATQLSVLCDEASPVMKNGFVVLEKRWETGDQIQLTFVQDIKAHKLANEEVYLQRGPLVYAYEIPHRIEVIKQYEGSTFTDYHCYPKNTNYNSLSLPKVDAFIFEYEDQTDNLNPWYDNRPVLKSEDMTLVPMGSTVLRRVTFPEPQ